MGFFSKAVGGLLGGGGESSSTSRSGFALLPKELQNAYKSYAPLLNEYLNPNTAGNVDRFTPLPLGEGENNALAALARGFTPDAAQLGSDIAMQTNPFDSYVIDDINRQAQGENSILSQRLNESGQFGSNRELLGANDIDLTRLNLIGKFKQDQYNQALNNSLGILSNSRRADAAGALEGGTYARGIDTATKQAPISALTSFGQLLGALPESGGSEMTQKTESGGFGGLGDIISGVASSFTPVGGFNIGAATSGLPWSDSRLKRDIKAVGTRNGFSIYRFKYLWSPIEYIGVMAQEVLEKLPAAVHNINGNLAVDYSMLGFDMERA